MHVRYSDLMRTTWMTAAVAAFALLVVACGGGGAKAATGGALTQEQQIKKNWLAFFDGQTPAKQKLALLEDSQKFASVIDAQSQLPLAQSIHARVQSVEITSSTTATVHYSLLAKDQVVLPDQTGQAVKQAGVWKVGARSLQGLLEMEGQLLPSGAPSGLPSMAPSTAPSASTGS